jgi:hypothetical protein
MPPSDHLPPDDLAGPTPDMPPVLPTRSEAEPQPDVPDDELELPDPPEGTQLLDVQDDAIKFRDPQDRRRERLRARLKQLRQRLERLRGVSVSKAEETATELVDLEKKFLQLAQQAEHALPDVVAQRGHPVLDDLVSWEATCQSAGALEAERAADELGREVFRDDAERWARRLDQQLEAHQEDTPNGPSADWLFSGLLEATAQHVESLRNQLKQMPALDEIHAIRNRYREQFAKQVAAHPPSEDELENWATYLVDQADSQLAAVPEQEPEASAAYLRVLIDDIEWYERQVPRKGKGRAQRKLRGKIERLKNEWQEQVLEDRLETKYGRGWVALWERMILVSIFVVLVLITALIAFGDSMTPGLMWTLEGFDALICAFFLTDFFGKMYYAPDHWRYFRRHWLFSLLPSIPFGLILLVVGAVAAPHADPTRYGRLARLMQLPRLVRYLALLRPAIALLRAFAFMVRGMDRIARMFGPLLNRNVILFPTRDERTAARHARLKLATLMRQFRAELIRRWRVTLETAPKEKRDAIGLMRVEGLRSACDLGYCLRPPAQRRKALGEHDISAEEMLRWLAGVTPQDVEAELGEQLVPRAARFIRLFSRVPMRWLPIISSCVPRVVVTMTDSEVIAAATRRTAAYLKRWHNTWFTVSDLYGTVTPSQFVDRTAQMLINSSKVPFFRLLNFGGLYLLVLFILWMFPYNMPDFVMSIFGIIQRLIGVTVLVLGGICAVIWGLGLWLQKLAQEATDFYERAAHAQYLTLTEAIRCRSLIRDAEIISDRVLLPETRIWLNRDDEQIRARQRRAFIERIKRSLMGLHIHGDTSRGFDPLERVVMLYRDALDGALLTDNDTRTTNQLLGNPAIQQFQSWSERVSGGEAAALQKLDLTRQKSLLPGPYLWFNFITQAIAHSAAQLILEYNRHAVPIPERAVLSEDNKKRFECWLKRETDETAQSRLTEMQMAGQYVTTSFTALHFLDVDPHRDQEVADLFGSEVLARMQHDRGVMIRRIFGTYPLHNKPRDRRSVNLQTVYDEWFSGGRMVLLPVYLFWRLLKSLGSLVAFLWRSARELQRPHLRRSTDDAAQADFGTACRKIDRMRGPITRAATMMRTLIDPEYLGINIPGLAESTLGRADVESDLEFLDAEPTVFEEIRFERQRAEADMQRLGGRIEAGLMKEIAEKLGLAQEEVENAEHLRAAACAYLADHSGVRRHLSCHAIIRQVFDRAGRQEALPLRLFPMFRLKGAFGRWWKQYGLGGKRARRMAWRAVAHNTWGVADCLEVWDKHGDTAEEEGVRIMTELLRQPARINEQLVSIRMVQTLAVLDVLNYRQHVFQLGNYAAQGDIADEFLAWGPITARADAIETPTLTNLKALQASFGGSADRDD